MISVAARLKAEAEIATQFGTGSNSTLPEPNLWVY
jgi:hypothetical protein